MQLDKPFVLAAVLGAETSAAQDQNHRLLSLQLREPAVFGGVVGQLIVGEGGAWNHVGSHIKISSSIDGGLAGAADRLMRGAPRADND